MKSAAETMRMNVILIFSGIGEGITGDKNRVLTHQLGVAHVEPDGTHRQGMNCIIRIIGRKKGVMPDNIPLDQDHLDGETTQVEQPLVTQI